jgi:hypothetical protein
MPTTTTTTTAKTGTTTSLQHRRPALSWASLRCSCLDWFSWEASWKNDFCFLSKKQASSSKQKSWSVVARSFFEHPPLSIQQALRMHTGDVSGMALLLFLPTKEKKLGENCACGGWRTRVVVVGDWIISTVARERRRLRC